MGHNGHRINLYGVVMILMGNLHAGRQSNLGHLSILHLYAISGADPGFGNGGGGKISSEASYERSELRAKRVTSEASINQLGVRGIFLNLEPLRVNLSVI